MNSSRSSPEVAATTNATFRQIADVIRSAQRFCVLSHFRPDGDAIGSEVALGLSLLEMGKEVHILNDDGCPDRFRFLPGTDRIIRPPEAPLDVQVTISCDAAARSRFSEKAFVAGSAAGTWINIDHHVSNTGYGDLNCVDDSSPATAQILYELLDEQELPLNRDIAANLYVGISTDTGSFQYPSTSAKTYRIASRLIELGIDIGHLNAMTYSNYPFRRTQLLRELLNVLKLSCDGKIASWALPLETRNTLGVQAEDTDALIDHLRSIEGVIVAAFFEQHDDESVRISLRSQDDRCDVGAICKLFGGGGHRLAAGARARGSVSEVEKSVLEEICRVIESIS
jgi:phosphoesterase RecJ-like protein